ncbi:hypothetical protein RCL1_007401 [Eukaryota sp. TZLM3-RCL]
MNIAPLVIIFLLGSCVVCTTFSVPHQIQNHSLAFKWTLIGEYIDYGHFNPGVARTIWPGSTSAFSIETHSTYMMALDYELKSASLPKSVFVRLSSQFKALNSSWECSTVTRGAAFSGTGTNIDSPLCTFSVFDNIDIPSQAPVSSTPKNISVVEIMFYNRDMHNHMYLKSVQASNIDAHFWPDVLYNNTYNFIRFTPNATDFDFTVSYGFLGQTVIMTGLKRGPWFVANGLSRVSTHHSVITGTSRTEIDGEVYLSASYAVPYFSDDEDTW